MSPPPSFASRTPQKKQTLSDIAWEYFTPLEPEGEGDDNQNASCDLCKTVISYKNHSYLRRHLKRKHSELAVLNGNEVGHGKVYDNEERGAVTAEERCNNESATKKSADKKKKHKKLKHDESLQYYTDSTGDANNVSMTESEYGESSASTLNPALAVVENILGQLPKKVRVKAEIDILNMAYSLYSEHCE